jgi:hypothetical protein
VTEEINGKKKGIGPYKEERLSLLSLFLYPTLKGRKKEIVFFKPFKAQRLVTLCH